MAVVFQSERFYREAWPTTEIDRRSIFAVVLRRRIQRRLSR
jgi:hypothetical protein